jgi:hypothetical protein
MLLVSLKGGKKKRIFCFSSTNKNGAANAAPFLFVGKVFVSARLKNYRLKLLSRKSRRESGGNF